MSENGVKNPLLGLIGTWKGDKGTDLAPKPEEDENNPYYETLVIEAVDIEIENAEEQELRAVRYNQIVREKSNDKVSHDETGFWIWDKNNQSVMNAFVIPRGVSLLAGGDVYLSDNTLTFNVASKDGDEHWGISQSPFMKSKAKTLEFKRTLYLNGDQLSYEQITTVDIYGKIFEHKDDNVLFRV